MKAAITGHGRRGQLMDHAPMIKDLEIAKRILSNLNTPLNGMMRIRIGQVISEAIDALKIEEKHNEDN